MSEFALVPHPDFPSNAVEAIDVAVTRHAGDRLDLEFRVIGALDRVAWPEWLGVEFADGLWEHSCFEAFVGDDDTAGYVEFNFATSGRWAAYRFDGYREGMRPIADALISGGRSMSSGEVRVRRSVRVPLGEGDWRLGLAAIIEAADGSKSYWALAHPSGKPDFHASICFAARLAAPERP